jgi:hypothetical protein
MILGRYHARGAAAKALLVGLIASGAVATGSACTAAPRAAAATRPQAVAAVPFPALKPFFVPGETVTWDVTMAGIRGARARLAVSETTVEDGRRTVVLRAEAESSGIAVLIKEARSAYVSWIDADTGVPRRTESDSAGLTKTLTVHASRRLDDDGAPLADFRVLRGKHGEEPNEVRARTRRLPVFETHDPLSATLALRAWKAPAGTRALLYSLGGVRMWKTTLTHEGSEELKTEIGRRRAVRIAGVSVSLTPSFDEDRAKPPRTFTIWVSDDDQRVPLRITARTELGDVTAKVTSYQAPEI